MAERVRVSDLDFIYISYTEPNKEQNWADLKNKVPWAKRVDGVVGFDSAHKAAADIAETDFFISVDGDNIIDEKFLLQTLDWSKTDKKAVHRWRANNNINGLVYGNGGLVGWDKETVKEMKTHENAETEENQLDFCWGVPHENLHNCYSKTVINASEQQAFVAGYREGVKMSTDKGRPIPAEDFQKVWPNNLRILSTWCTVGADVENGKYAMLGARMGCFNTVIESNNEHFKIRDLDNMELYYKDQSPTDIDTDLLMYGNSLRQQLDMPIAEYDEDESRFYRFVMPPHINKGVQDREY
jgi:hypothetical protein|tara:strand:+ start:261 stop:1154 length:894 start_codon:yes stop_codon:yes gene_type:complete